jgi:hypothetical protein
VVDNAISIQDVAAEHALELGRRIDPMRARGDENRDVFGSDLRHLLEERAQHVAARLRPGDVAH